MLNLTPHPITLRTAEGEVTFPPSGTVARVATIETVIGSLMVEGIEVPVVSRVFGEVTGLPEEGTACIVSSMVLDAVKGRHGVYAPDSGPTAIRGEKGFVIAVTRLVAA